MSFMSLCAFNSHLRSYACGVPTDEHLQRRPPPLPSISSTTLSSHTTTLKDIFRQSDREIAPPSMPQLRTRCEQPQRALLHNLISPSSCRTWCTVQKTYHSLRFPLLLLFSCSSLAAETWTPLGSTKTKTCMNLRQRAG